MPVTAKIDNPFAAGQLNSAWVYCRVAAFDFGAKTGRLVYEVYASREAAYGEKPPLRVIEVALGTPAEHGPPPLLSAGKPAVYETVVIREPGTDGEDDPGELRTVVVEEAQDPIYGEAPLLRPAIPSLVELIAGNQAAYAALQGVVDELTLLLPELEDATVIE